jgi:hypothetical protein
MPQDEDGHPFVRVDWDVRHLRMLHNAIDFYLEHRVEEFDKTKKELPEPTEAVLDMKNTLNRMILEFNYFKSNTDSV